MAKFKLVREATKYNPYAVGMAVAKKAAGLGKTQTHDLPKAIITKAHDIAKRIKSNEEFDDLLLADIIDEVKETPITMPDNPDYSKYDKPTFQRKNPKPEHKTPEWVGKNTDKPAYKRKAENEGK
jgi:hypothetical protein